MTIKDFAARHGVSQTTVANYIRSGALRCKLIDGHYDIPARAAFKRRPVGRPSKSR